LSNGSLNIRFYVKTLQIDVFIAYNVNFVQCHTIWNKSRNRSYEKNRM